MPAAGGASPPDVAARRAPRGVVAASAATTIPLYAPRPPELADAWHRVTAPGGYEWWYLDAEDPASDVQVVAILFQGFVFHPEYLRRDAAYRRCPTSVAPAVPAEYPAAYFAVYEKGRLTAQFMTQFPPAAFDASDRTPATVSVGPNRLWRDDAGGGGGGGGGALRLHVEGTPWALTWQGPKLRDGSTLAADLTFVPRIAAAPPQERRFFSGAMSRGAEHHWVIADPMCDVSGEIRVPTTTTTTTTTGGTRTIQLTGRGYHDHNYGTGPIGPGLKRWVWGRALLGDRVVTFHVARPRDVRLPVETHVVIGDADGVREVPDAAAADVRWRRWTALGLKYPSSIHIGDLLRLRAPRVVDPSPFYLRLTYDADCLGDRGRAFCEVAYPHRLRWPVLGRMIGMSIDKRAT